MRNIYIYSNAYRLCDVTFCTTWNELAKIRCFKVIIAIQNCSINMSNSNMLALFLIKWRVLTTQYHVPNLLFNNFHNDYTISFRISFNKPFHVLDLTWFSQVIARLQIHAYFLYKVSLFSTMNQMSDLTYEWSYYFQQQLHICSVVTIS